MAIVLYELGGKDGQRYSQFSWRTRLALAHKGLDFDTVPVAVSDKEKIAFSGQGKVPILKDGDHVVADSWKIAEHLEKAYPDRPSLFGGERGQALARFINTWADRQLVPRLTQMLMIDVLGIVDDKDAAHMRKTIEAAFKKSLEELSARRGDDIAGFRRLLDPGAGEPAHAAVHQRRDPGLRRLYRVQPAAMGTHRQRFRGDRGHRSDRRLARAHARPLRRPRAQGE